METECRRCRNQVHARNERQRNGGVVLVAVVRGSRGGRAEKSGRREMWIEEEWIKGRKQRENRENPGRTRVKERREWSRACSVETKQRQNPGEMADWQISRLSSGGREYEQIGRRVIEEGEEEEEGDDDHDDHNEEE